MSRALLRERGLTTLPRFIVGEWRGRKGQGREGTEIGMNFAS